MMYDERMVAPMRAEITRLGVEELRTGAAVDTAMKETKGTQLVIVNSVCGCAARNMRPAAPCRGSLPVGLRLPCFGRLRALEERLRMSAQRGAPWVRSSRVRFSGSPDPAPSPRAPG